jgi:hypothetical protein
MYSHSDFAQGAKLKLPHMIALIVRLFLLAVCYLLASVTQITHAPCGGGAERL